MASVSALAQLQQDAAAAETALADQRSELEQAQSQMRQAKEQRDKSVAEAQALEKRMNELTSSAGEAEARVNKLQAMAGEVQALRVIEVGGDGKLVYGAALWTATAKGADGAPQEIGGTATHIFERQGDGGLKVKLHTFN